MQNNAVYWWQDWERLDRDLTKTILLNMNMARSRGPLVNTWIRTLPRNMPRNWDGHADRPVWLTVTEVLLHVLGVISTFLDRLCYPWHENWLKSGQLHFVCYYTEINALRGSLLIILVSWPRDVVSSLRYIKQASWLISLNLCKKTTRQIPSYQYIQTEWEAHCSFRVRWRKYAGTTISA